MAKNFGNSAMAKRIEQVKQTSAEKAQVIVIKMIKNDDLLDYSKNREDITNTIDLENSILEIGFSDPLEVTDFGASDGKYIIVSGHRRRSAGVKCGMNLFPCIVRSFSSEAQVENYVLLSNSQRDSEKDPLLFCARYKMHEEYLKNINFDGKMRDEIAKRLGISIAQADRYNTMNKVILQVWDMVRQEKVGMSSVLPLASHTEAEQLEIYKLMCDALDNNILLTRETVKNIVDGYRHHKTENTHKPTPKEKIKNSAGIKKEIKKFNKQLNSEYEFETINDAEETISDMANTVSAIVDKMYSISKEYKLDDVFKDMIQAMQSKVENIGEIK